MYITLYYFVTLGYGHCPLLTEILWLRSFTDQNCNFGSFCISLFSFSISIFPDTWRPVHDNYNLDYCLPRPFWLHTLEDQISCQLLIFIVLNLFCQSEYNHYYNIFYFVKAHVRIYTKKAASYLLVSIIYLFCLTDFISNHLNQIKSAYVLREKDMEMSRQLKHIYMYF